MSQQPTESQCPSYQQPRKSSISKSWMVLPAVLLLALFLLIGPGKAHAATSTSTVTTHPNSSATCNYRTYTLAYTLELVDHANGTVLDYQASNLNGYYSVKIAHNGYYLGEYYLPTYDDYDRVRIYAGSNGVEYVDACLD